MRWIARVVLLTSVAAVAAGVGFAAAGDDSHSASAHGKRSHGPFGFGKVVFLSHVNTVGMPIFPGDPPFELETLFTVENDGFKLNKMTIGEHSGTHWGAPCHFNDGEPCADQMDAKDFFHPAAVVDARRQTAKDPDYALTVADLKRFERKHGRIPRNAVVVMWTGWQERWGDPGAFFNQDADGVMHFPGISVEATQWLIDHRKLGGLGIDTHGVDPGSDTSYATNTLLLQGHRIHIENMAGLDKMPPNSGWIVVGGVRNEGGSGSPATVFGLVP
jgi:kynurenine formamidase